MILPSAPLAPASNHPQPEGDLRRWQNRALILEQIRTTSETSRRELHELTGIRPNTVGEIVTDLLNEGLVEEIGEVQGRRGRRRRLLSLASESSVVGAELFEGAIRVGRVGLRGDLRVFNEHRLRSQRRDRVIDTLIKAIQPLVEMGDTLGVGLAAAGVVDSSAGISRRIRGIEEWEDVPVVAILEERLGVRTHLANLTDVRLIDLKQRGKIEPGMTAVLVVIEPGRIGCGIIAEGHLLRGAVEASSELGQTKVCIGDEIICLEDMVDTKFLRRRVREIGGTPPRDLRVLLRSDDPATEKIRTELAERLGISLANMVLLIKPSKMWLGGSVSSHRSLTEAVCSHLRANLLPSFDAALTIETLDNSPEDGARGAAGLVLDTLFAKPDVRAF